MASATSSNPRCVTCQKAAGTFTCRGCSKDFCLRHVSEHRQLLSKQLDETVVLVHDQLQQVLNEYISKPDLHPLVKQVDEWEQDSIEKIHRTADDIRKHLVAAIGHHADSIKKSSASLTQLLSKAHQDDEFFENDIEQWKQKLDDLRQKLNAPETIKIQKNSNSIPFISEIVLIDDSSMSGEFDRLLGEMNIEENGQVVVHGKTNTHAAVRGKGAYSSGQHKFKFRIEQLGSNRWILFGIISKNAPLIAEALYDAPQSCGWGGNNSVFINGSYEPNFKGYATDIAVNDILELLVDCDQRKIRLTNERSHSIHELDIDLAKCPFPWQISLNIYDAGGRVRLL